MDIKILGSKILKINAEVKPTFSGKLKIDTNINLKSIEKFKPELSNINSIKTDATFKISYDELGFIEISGQLFLSCDNDKQIDEIVSNFDQKKFDSIEIISIMNIIMQKFSIKAFEIEEELGLPIHIKLPSLSSKKNND
jgi:acyl carrier protein